MMREAGLPKTDKSSYFTVAFRLICSVVSRRRYDGVERDG